MAELQQETYDLKLRIFHLREKSDKVEEQLEQAELDRDHALNERNHALRERDEAFRERDEANAFAARLIRDIEMRDEAILQAAVKITGLEVELDAAYNEFEADNKDNESTIMPKRQCLDVEKSPHFPDKSSLRAMKSSPPVKTRNPSPAGEDSSTPVQQNLQNTPQPGEGSLVRMPSFLSDHDPETGALRAMFLPGHQSINSLAMVSENEGGYNQFGERSLNSPRLSLISESSLPSVYPKKQQYDEQYESGYSDVEHIQVMKRELTKPNIREWAGGVGKGESFEDIGSVERKHGCRSSSRRETRKQAAVEKGYVSRADAADAPPLSKDELQRRLINKTLGVNGIVHRRRQRFSEARASDSSPSFQAQVRNVKKNDKRDAESFAGGRILPPTPDTFSTNTLQGQVNPPNGTLNNTLNGTLSSNKYRIERGTPQRLHKMPSFEDKLDKRRSRMGALFDPAPEKELDHNGKRLSRRRSLAETITSRRECHGWDTATPSESQAITETNSDMSSEATSKDPYAFFRPHPHSAAFNPPDLFSMVSSERCQPKKEEWDITVDLKTPGKVRTSTGTDHRSRDCHDTPTKGRYRERSYSTYSAETRRQSAGPEIEHSFHSMKTPSAPERRSSLAGTPMSNEKRMRRLRENQEAASMNSSPIKQSSPLRPKQPAGSITEPLLNTSQLLPPAEEPQQKKGLLQRVNFGNFRNITNPPFLNRGQKENRQLGEERATPPPIKRSGKNERTEMARKEAAERHLKQQWSSPNPGVRPSTADGDRRESRRAVTFGGEEGRDIRMSQPSRTSDSQQELQDEIDAQKALDAESNKTKKWGFSLGNRTLRRK